MTIGNILAKGSGLAGLGVIAYDAHQYGKIKAKIAGKNQQASSALDSYMDTTQLNSTSTIMNKIQNKRHSLEMDGKLLSGPRNFFSRAKGYIKGVAESLASNVVPLALTAGTLLTKGKISQGFGIGLAAYGAVQVGRNAFGAGRTNYLK